MDRCYVSIETEVMTSSDCRSSLFLKMEANDFKISQVEATFHFNEGTALNVLISNLAVCIYPVVML